MKDAVLGERHRVCECRFFSFVFRDTTPLYRAVAAILFALTAALLAQGQQLARPGSSGTNTIPAAEFSRMIREFSEPGGYFPSDNFVSNETSYLHVVDKLKELQISGGAYIGVGPEQNFTYIAKIRPSIAFIVDIRRQAIIEHLLYKAVFHRAKDRAEFLSLLFSKPFSPARLEGEDSLRELLKYVAEAPTNQELFSSNLAAIRKTIEEEFEFPLSPEDAETLGHTYHAFWRANLGITERGRFPTLQDLVLETDLQGRLGNFLADEHDYNAVRELQERNRVIPIVGDFAGRKAIASVADYLRKNGYTTSAFYTSNVEQYLFGDGVFSQFVENIRKLPVSDRSVMIRSVMASQGAHPALVSGNRMTTLLEKFTVFLADFRAGLYPNYWSLVTTHYISGNIPQREVSLPAVSEQNP